MTDDDNVRRLLGVVPDNPRPADHDEPPARTQDDAAYQSWLRRRIATLKHQQHERILQIEQKKHELDALVAHKQAEIDNLESQRTIGVVE
jgi:hypothetical protein